MANTKSAAKRARQDVVRHGRNISILTRLKTEQKKLRKALEEKQIDTARLIFKEFCSQLDKAAKRGVIHRNSVDRKKSVYNRKLQTVA